MTPLAPRQLARNSALNLLGQGLPLLAALPAVPLLITHAGPDRFGLLALLWAILGSASLLDLGMGRALTHGVAERAGSAREGEIAGVMQTGLRLAFALGAVFGVILVLLAPLASGVLVEVPALRAEAVAAFRWVGVGVPVVIVTSVLRGGLEGLHRFAIVNAVRVPLGVATFLAPVAVLPWTRDLGVMAAALVAARALGWAGYHWALHRSLPEEAPQSAGDRRAQAASLIRFGGWATVSNVITPLLVQADRFVIAGFLTLTAVAWYATPFEVVARLLVVPSALAAVFFPAFARAATAAPDELSRLFVGSTRGILLLILPPALLLFTFAPEGLRLWVGPDFAAAGAPVARWLLLGIVLNAVAHVPFALVQGVGRPDLSARLHLVELPVYAGALLWAVPRWGITGAAAVWAGRAGLDLVLLLWASRRVLPALAAETGRALLLAIAGAALLPLPLALPGPAARAAVVAVATVALGLLGWRWGRALVGGRGLAPPLPRG